MQGFFDQQVSDAVAGVRGDTLRERAGCLATTLGLNKIRQKCGHPPPLYYKQFANRLACARLAEHEKLRFAALFVLAFANCGRVSPRAPLALSQTTRPLPIPLLPAFFADASDFVVLIQQGDRYKAFNAVLSYGHLEEAWLGLFNVAFGFLHVH